MSPPPVSFYKMMKSLLVCLFSVLMCVSELCRDFTWYSSLCGLIYTYALLDRDLDCLVGVRCRSLPDSGGMGLIVYLICNWWVLVYNYASCTCSTAIHATIGNEEHSKSFNCVCFVCFVFFFIVLHELVYCVSPLLDRSGCDASLRFMPHIYMISLTTRCTHNTVPAVTSQTNKRHIAAVKQLILILLVYVISFLPLLLAGNVPGTSFWIVYFIFINNVANFFIYLAVNKEFRNETKIMINVILKKMRPGKEQTIFVLRWFRPGLFSDSLSKRKKNIKNCLSSTRIIVLNLVFA